MSRTPAPVRAACGLLFALAVQSCTSETPKADSAAVDSAGASAARAEVDAVLDRLVVAWNGEDPAAVESFYATDATVYGPDSTYTGRDEIRDLWITPTLPVLDDLVLGNVEIVESGDGYVSTGNCVYMLTLSDSAPLQVKATYRIAWKRENGAWVVATEALQLDGPEIAE